MPDPVTAPTESMDELIKQADADILAKSSPAETAVEESGKETELPAEKGAGEDDDLAQDEKYKELTKNQEKIHPRFKEVYREKREMEKKAKALEGRLLDNEWLLSEAKARGLLSQTPVKDTTTPVKDEVEEELAKLMSSFTPEDMKQLRFLDLYNAKQSKPLMDRLEKQETVIRDLLLYRKEIELERNNEEAVKLVEGKGLKWEEVYPEAEKLFYTLVKEDPSWAEKVTPLLLVKMVLGEKVDDIAKRLAAAKGQESNEEKKRRQVETESQNAPGVGVHMAQNESFDETLRLARQAVK